ncbi:hypothetical protein OF83DRAFT_678389 [Amylostereum chailletii]|nr:hypothetical protein OF83DRAFT_678389 [Amylostereum chailletii]
MQYCDDGTTTLCAKPFTPACVDDNGGQNTWVDDPVPIHGPPDVSPGSKLWYWVDWRKMLCEANKGRMVLASQIEEIEEEMAPLEETEQEIWRADGRNDPFNQDQIFKRCQHRVRIAPPNTVGLEMTRLKLLNELRNLRKKKFDLLQRLLPSISPHANALPQSPHTEVHTTVMPDPSLGSKFWAIVVGINSYSSYHLKGCVPDAYLMREYLVSDLSIPPSQIKFLTEHSDDSRYNEVQPDGPPTRENIISQLYSHIRDNPSIQRDDKIIFYFSGHGSSYNASEYFRSDSVCGVGAIEALCPADRGGKLAEGCEPQCEEPFILDISDRELNTIFGEIRDIRCPNIIVILDCCHSGGSTRTIDAPVTRYAAPLPQCLEKMLCAADKDPRRPPSHKPVLTEEWKEDMSSLSHWWQRSGHPVVGIQR